MTDNLPALQAQRPTPILPNSFETAWRMATAISKSGLAPRGITTTEAIFTAMQLGAEVGLTPMAALQNIAVVNGRPTIWGDAQLALVRASGLLTDFKETYQGEEGTDGFKAVCVARRVGENDHIINEFSIADAKTAGLWGKEGPWRTNPKRMLKMRARAFTMRDGFTDILKGIYSREEMEGAPPTRENANVDALNAEFVNVDKEHDEDDSDACSANDIYLVKWMAEDLAAQKQAIKEAKIEPVDLTPPDFLNKNKLSPEQEALGNLIAHLKTLKKAERPSAFLEMSGLHTLELAGRNATTDKMINDLGIVLP